MSGSSLTDQLDLYLGYDGGYAYQRDGPIGKGMRNAFSKLLWKHGEHGLLPIHHENGLFNFYLRGGVVNGQTCSVVKGKGKIGKGKKPETTEVETVSIPEDLKVSINMRQDQSP